MKIKNDITKERRVYFAMTLFVKFFVFGSTALFDDFGDGNGFGFIQIPLPYDIVQIVQFFYGRLLEPT